MPELQETNRIKPMTPLSAKRIELCDCEGVGVAG